MVSNAIQFISKQAEVCTIQMYNVQINCIEKMDNLLFRGKTRQCVITFLKQFIWRNVCTTDNTTDV